jgi:hypothetical protein
MDKPEHEGEHEEDSAGHHQILTHRSTPPGHYAHAR